MSNVPTGYRQLTVSDIVAETHDSTSVLFEVPAADAASFQYKPGQFLTLRLPVGGRHVPRCYSMSSAPALDAGLRVTVKRVATGRGSNWVCDQLKRGDTLEVLPPAGVFTPRSLEDDFLLLAGGSGITPVFSILRSALAAGQGRILLVYANRDERSVIFRQELSALAASHPHRLSVIHWLDSVQGIPTAAQLAELARPMKAAQAFICGPAPFMVACEAALHGLGMDDSQIRIERFVSLPDEEDEGRAAASVTPAALSVDHAEIEVSHQGQVHRFTCGGAQTILEVALRERIELPYSCQAGLCASCMCQLIEGQVHLRANESLDKKDLAKGWILACQAVPTTPKVRIRFAE